jgi:hypothetical protein
MNNTLEITYRLPAFVKKNARTSVFSIQASSAVTHLLSMWREMDTLPGTLEIAVRFIPENYAYANNNKKL